MSYHATAYPRPVFSLLSIPYPPIIALPLTAGKKILARYSIALPAQESAIVLFHIAVHPTMCKEEPG